MTSTMGMATMSGEHTPRPTKNPLYCDCGLAVLHHRPSHTPTFPVCHCGADPLRHRVRHRAYGSGEMCDCGLPRQNHKSDSIYTHEYIGIDGEGIGRKPHRYVLLQAATEEGQTWTIENLKGLPSADALQFIIDTLDGSRVFSYGFGYDISCLLRDLPNEAIYRLLRPSFRYGSGKLQPISWNGFKIDWLQGRFAVRQKGRSVVIWDLVKFFQCTFVKALEDWGIDPGDIDEMKQRRGRFKASEMPRIKLYCRDECIKLAKLARKLIETHRDVGLTLKSYYGPGSTASVAITKMGALEYRADPPKDMLPAIACGFFGGRFEHSVMGTVKPVWGYDISSAYPYQLYQLPCLKCGVWEHVSGKTRVRQALRGCTTALVRYRYNGDPAATWAPFSFRGPKGSICYPYRGAGWAWLPEIQAAQRLDWGRVDCDEAWVYRTDCTHRPFAGIADMYRQRFELGKDIKGRVLKNAVNSCYGKTVQSKGPKPKYQCWIWGSLVTSGTRAQLLDAIGSSTDPANIIALATDGVYSRERLQLAPPLDTGTLDLPKPLGGWEEKHEPDGMLFVKPGIYTTLGEGDLRARGVGRRALEASKKQLIRAWEQGDREFSVTVDRFCGAKTSISRTHKRSSRYGQWVRMPIRINFCCPNRTADMKLLATEGMSSPYKPGVITPEKHDAVISDAIGWEQP